MDTAHSKHCPPQRHQKCHNRHLRTVPSLTMSAGTSCFHPLLLLFYLLLLSSLCDISKAQTKFRNFPSLFNTAKLRPISTEPSQSTCGVPTRSAYCKSSTFQNSVSQCRQGFCIQDCPRRTTLPQSVELLVGAFGKCLITDTINTRPITPSGQYSIVFLPGTDVDCFIRPFTMPTLGANGQFTMAVWIWQEAGNNGTLIEKVDKDGKTIFHLEVSGDKIVFTYRTAQTEYDVQFTDRIPSRTWTHLAIQVYMRSISYYINGLRVGFSASGTQFLKDKILDGNGQVRVGQTLQGSGQFRGRLQDFKFFTVTLTNREVSEVYNGVFPKVYIQSACRCPASHPRVSPQHSRFCLQNGVPDNIGDEMVRLSNDSHPLEYINDGDSNSIWISGFQNDVFFTVDLGDQFQVFYVVLQFYSPQPKIVTIERKIDTSSSDWLRWQLYAEDCKIAFGLENNGRLQNSTSVNCLQFGTGSNVIAYSKGNITFNILAGGTGARPGHNNFYYTPALFEFVKASQVRIRMQDHFYVTHQRHQYYGLYELIVTGRCNCHGHAEKCDTSVRPYVCNCLPESNTIGNKCDACKPLYNDKPFRSGDQVDAFNCKPCQCYNHATSCVYNASLDPFPQDHNRGGGGVCVDCAHNTEGRQCDRCKAFYYRPIGVSLTAVDVCRTCDCNATGASDVTLECARVGGQCPCKQNVGGRQCDTCKDGFYSLSAANPNGCINCSCNIPGTVNGGIACHATTGQCNCKRNVRERQCLSCAYGYFNLSMDNPDGCTACNCNPVGSNNDFCNPLNGNCACKANIEGRQCDRCVVGFYDFSSGCKPCSCNTLGAEVGKGCNSTSGQCLCKPYVQGLTCNECKDGYHSLGTSSNKGCQPCKCEVAGTNDTSRPCDHQTGKCECKQNVQGTECNQCKGNTWGLNVNNSLGCEPCNCDPTGTLQGNQLGVSDLSCNQNSGQCTCLANRKGRRCETCEPGFYVSKEAGGGCLRCGCDSTGTIGGTTCDPQTGQCVCRGDGSGVGGQNCNSCLPRYHSFDPGTGRCSPCNCNAAGSMNDTCNANTGQCVCKPFVVGDKCDTCMAGTSNLEAENPFGCSKAPSQQPPPKVENLSPTALRLYWDPPDYPNGVIINYHLYRDDQKITTLEPNTLEYNDTGLQPYTEYTYNIVAENAFGPVSSPKVTYRTLASIPTGVIKLRARNIGAQSATLLWNAPNKTNGLITHYELRGKLSTQSNFVQFWNGSDLQATLYNLGAFRNYTFQVLACTESGCLQSNALPVSTLQTAPEKQGPPTVQPLSASSFYINWSHPDLPNGIIIFYELWMRGLARPDGSRDPEETRIFHQAGQYNPQPTQSPQENALPPPATNFTLIGLKPYTVYEFQVLAENSAGKAASPWVAARTLEAVPLFMAAPEVIGVSSREVNISWSAPTEVQARGQIIKYYVYQYMKTDLSKAPFAPPYFWLMVRAVDGKLLSYKQTGLAPYTDYTFKLGACNGAGCVNSSTSVGRTLAAAPSGLDRSPSADGYNSTAMAVLWAPPSLVNGPAPLYTVERMTTAFNHPPPLVERGTRFPGGGYYLYPPETVPQGVGFTGFELWFRTEDNDGLLIFSASEGRQDEFVALQLKSGRPWFVFDPQGCLAGVTPNISTTVNVNFTDGQWHRVVARRWETSGTILVDGVYKGETTSTCATGNIIGRNTGVYLGGIPKDYVIYRNPADKRYAIERKSFRGCIRDVRILVQQTPEEIWRPLDWTSAVSRDQSFPHWEGCPVNLESDGKGGILHFLGRGYAMMPLKYFTNKDEVGPTRVDLDFRTDRKSGLLFFVHGLQGHYILAQINDTVLEVKFGASPIRGQITVSSDQFKLCDGEWWNFEMSKAYTSTLKQFKLRVKNKKTGKYVTTGTEKADFDQKIILSSRFYLGGVPFNSEAATFAEANGLGNLQEIGFGGCMDRFKVNYAQRRIFHESYAETYNVNTDGCPPDPTIAQTCGEVKPSDIYSGPRNSTMDYGLLPFTDYLYRVKASNSEGSTSSPWGIGRTREGAPTGLAPPYNVRAVTGYQITGSWNHPTGRTGLLTQYILRAYSLDKPDEPPVETIYNNTALTSGRIDNAVPFTNYSVKFVACTLGGCTESASAPTITTKEEAPDQVYAPVGTADSTFIMLSWKPPGRPNGINTGYYLFMDGVEKYSGNELFFNVTGLKVYTSYNFFVRACTRIGCKDSPTITVSTLQLPPTFMAPPKLTILGTKRIRADWQQPQQLNGQLERYLVYLSRTIQDIGQPVYNNSDLFLNYVLDQLQAGTQYFIRVAACTGGGCRISDASPATTEESAPEGVPLPNITSPSPSQLFVTWGAPVSPNGIIVEYRLYQNGLMVYNHTSKREYSVANLQPWSLHTFRVVACTSRGCGSSNEVQARTQEAPPAGFIVMELSVDGPRTISVKWNAVATPNGQMFYDVFVQGQFYEDPENWNYKTVQSRRSLYRSRNSGIWIKIQGLIPYSMYQVQVNGSNTKGYVNSNVISANMPMGSPDGVKPPDLVSPSSTSVRATWQEVGRANANQLPVFQLQYRHKSPGAVVIDLFPKGTTSTTYLKENLQPFTEYEFRVTARNAYGTTISEWNSVITKQDKPSSIDPPMTSQVQSRQLRLSWSSPLKPNGIVQQYNIYQNNAVKLQVTGNITEVIMSGLTPNTVYVYKVEGCTEGGCTMSAESQPVTTSQAGPGAIRPPTVSVLGPTSILVSWQPPINPNGQLEKYIIRLPAPQFEIRNISKLSETVTGLTPFTRYDVTIVACTDGGCTESTATTVYTKPTIPEGQKTPTTTPVSQTIISVLWEAPSRPNGPNIRYELSRMKVRQPLNPSATGFGSWVSVYSGNGTFLEDRHLTIFTTYKYRVTVYNDYGQMTSQPSAEVSTYGGQPQVAPSLTVSVINHVSVRAEWTPPGVMDLQGAVVRYDLHLISYNQNITKMYGPGVNVTVVTGLQPNTDYNVSLKLTINGGAFIIGGPQRVRTKDGAPTGLAAPRLFFVNVTALRVSWTAPAQPNGAVTGYNIYVNGKKTETGMTEAGSFVIGKLQPYTVYNVYVEVCTVFSCISSNVTQGTTSEAKPDGVKQPDLMVLGPYSIKVTWTVPSKPNGIIRKYEVWRKDKVPCSSLSQPTISPESSKCSYVECKSVEGLCGSICYSGPQTCCGGVLFKNIAGYECCGSSYIPKRVRPDDVCCNGKFYTQKPNYQCCGGRYVLVPNGHICCPDSVQERVDVGLGDQCCASVPYSSTGAQMCCDGQLYDRFGQQCCGKKIISDSLTCCGGEEKGTAYSTENSKMCCGSEYARSDISACCTDKHGNTKLHSYASPLLKNSANDKCCGLERISAVLSCCNSVGYNPLVQTCADREGCGTGTICQGSSSLNALCDRCNFTTATSRCSITSTNVTRLPPTTAAPSVQPPTLCTQDPVRVFHGLLLSFTDTNLTAYTQYEYYVTAVNNAGRTSSSPSSATTAQDEPQDVSPPVAKVLPDRLDTVYLSWSPPGKPNGKIKWYILLRDGIEIYRGVGMQYVDNNRIQPYQTYTYQLQACTVEGCTSSQQVAVSTLQAKPEQLFPPSITGLNATTLKLSWQAPGKPNGLITVYSITVTSTGAVVNTTGSYRTYLFTGLEPYTEYEFVLSACTQAGCTSTTPVKGKTTAAPPQGVSAPSVVIISASVVEIYWKAPSKPNGLITGYRVYRFLRDNAFSMIYSGGASVLTTRDSRLSPSTQYGYLVEATNTAGATRSARTVITSPASTPLGIPAPKVARALSSSAILVEWDPPSVPNGQIDQYRVIVNAGAENEIVRSVGITFTTNITGLEPYTDYNIRIQACLRGVGNGCGTGPAVTVRTLESLPESLPAPALKAISATVVEVTWQPPAKPNGMIVAYRVFRRPYGSQSGGLLVNVIAPSAGALRFNNVELQPFTEYEYYVLVVNSKGTASSPWARVRTLESAPTNLSSPAVNVTSAYSMTASWSAPGSPNGIITKYKIEYRPLSFDPTTQYPVNSVTVSGNVLSTSVSGLKPYTRYQVRLVAMNSAAQTASEWVEIITNQASPAGISDFTVEQITDGSAVILRWNPPAHPNGVIDNYHIYKDNSQTSVYSGLFREFELSPLFPATSYVVQLEACTEAGCSRGNKQTISTAEIPPKDLSTPTRGTVNSTYVIIRWKKPVNPNGKLLKYELIRRTDLRITKRDLSAPEVVYSTNDTSLDNYEYKDENLRPFTKYSYRVKASNSKGSVESDWVTVTTLQGAPDGLNPPVLSYVKSKYDHLNITWTAPRYPNGIIYSYLLSRNGSVPSSFNPDVFEYIDKGLLPYTYYSYTVTACTGALHNRCTTSQPSVKQTEETAPLSMPAPVVSAVNSTALKVTWSPPQITNGEVQLYRVTVGQEDKDVGLSLEYVIGNLIPYKAYIVSVTACTRGGCTKSVSVQGRPLEDVPTGLLPPKLIVTSSTSVEVIWEPPTNPNGIITSYEVHRNGSLVESRNNTTPFADYSLKPGTVYVYIVTAYNSKGSVTSIPVSVKTYSSSPSGLAPPELKPLSSTEIQVSWSEPSHPNGDIVNYTLYKNDDEYQTFRPSTKTYLVQKLQIYTQYAFKIRACTDKGCSLSNPSRASTLEAPPEGQGRPLLEPHVISGQHQMIISWKVPDNPNGAITKYEVYRRLRVASGEAVRPRIRVCPGVVNVLQCVDSNGLLPYTKYEYMVTSFNSRGSNSSRWAEATTQQAPPEGLSAPVITMTTQSTIHVDMPTVSKPNGIISYSVYLDDKLALNTRKTSEVLGLVTPVLAPFTEYEIYVQVCTSGGCTRSPTVKARTKGSAPAGIDPPVITAVTSTSINVRWSPPTQLNGIVQRYELSVRKSCPNPPDQPLVIPCTVSQPQVQQMALKLSSSVKDLKPYQVYDFMITAYNVDGSVRSTWTTNKTLAAVPVYKAPPKLSLRDTQIIVDWSSCFDLNGRILAFILYKDGIVEFNGIGFSHGMEKISNDKTHEFYVRLKTEAGQVDTPAIIFDPDAPNYIATTISSPATGVTAASVVKVYEEVWFIVIVALIILLILFICLALCLRYTSPRAPYIRERMPLQVPKEMKALPQFPYYGDHFDGSIISTEIPHKTASHLGQPGVGYENPAFTQMSGLAPMSRHDSMLDYNYDKMSQKSSKLLDEDYDDAVWDGHLPIDSGLQSYGPYDDDFDNQSSRPYSIVKEHVMFTDTHL